MSGDKTGGVYRISGTTEIDNGAQQSWSFILKVINPDPLRVDPAHYNYWRRDQTISYPIQLSVSR